MRMLILAAAIALNGCASAVYDSLDRRGVDSATILAERTAELQSDLSAAQSAIRTAASALAAIDTLDGAALSRQLDRARAAGQDAALAAQDVRLSTDSMKAAGARYFADREQELGLMKSGGETLRAAEAGLAAKSSAYRAFSSSVDAAALRLSPALSLHDAEVAALRKTPTSAIAAAARASERASAIRAAEDAADGLASAVSEAGRFLQSLR